MIAFFAFVHSVLGRVDKHGNDEIHSLALLKMQEVEAEATTMDSTDAFECGAHTNHGAR